MRCLSIRQPWAWCIVNGHKPVENRSWSTDFRGQVLVHAGKIFDAPAVEQILEYFPELEVVMPQQFELGGIVGVATITDCVTEHDSRWFVGEYGFVLADARPLPFRAWRGQLNFFDVPLDDALRAALNRPTTAQAESAGQERLLP
jgi:hypothetical protein